MSKRKTKISSLFEVGDIIGFDGYEDRVIHSVDHKKKIYGLGFTKDPTKVEYPWRFADAHHTYELVPPKYIPKEQYDAWRKLHGRYKPKIRA